MDAALAGKKESSVRCRGSRIGGWKFKHTISTRIFPDLSAPANDPSSHPRSSVVMDAFLGNPAFGTPRLRNTHEIHPPCDTIATWSFSECRLAIVHSIDSARFHTCSSLSFSASSTSTCRESPTRVSCRYLRSRNRVSVSNEVHRYDAVVCARPRSETYMCVNATALLERWCESAWHCAWPRGVKGESPWPWIRRATFASVSPCRINEMRIFEDLEDELTRLTVVGDCGKLMCGDVSVVMHTP